MAIEISKLLSVRFGDTFKFVLLLDGVAVRAALGGVNQLVSQALGDGLDVTERGLAGSGAQQPDCLKINLRSQFLQHWSHTDLNAVFSEWPRLALFTAHMRSFLERTSGAIHKQLDRKSSLSATPTVSPSDHLILDSQTVTVTNLGKPCFGHKFYKTSHSL